MEMLYLFVFTQFRTQNHTFTGKALGLLKFIGVDHGVFHVRVIRDGVEDPLEHPLGD
jgi:hypothetical protein